MDIRKNGKEDNKVNDCRPMRLQLNPEANPKLTLGGSAAEDVSGT
jgi:hypothetical protein